MEKLEVDFTLVGAGVVGLALAENLSAANPGRTVLLLERHFKFGQETSSHNSEVIHAGIYYKGAPLKAELCVRGNRLIYDFCRRYDVPFSNCGKFVIASREDQLPALQNIHDSARRNGAEISWVPRGEIGQRLQHSQAVEALWSPSTGIVDSHVLMQRLQDRAHNSGAILLYGHSFERLLDRVPGGPITIEVKDPKGELLQIETRAFVNCAGLAAGRVATQFLPGEGIEIRGCRGRYFSLSSRWSGRISELLYPVPDPAGGLGVHVTFDLSGKCRFGPDVDFKGAEGREPDDWGLYEFDREFEALQMKFFENGRQLLRGIEHAELSPDYVGVRPKLFVKGQAHADFLVKRSEPEAADWHFLGIESPGLTAALALAEKYGAEIARES